MFDDIKAALTGAKLAVIVLLVLQTITVVAVFAALYLTYGARQAAEAARRQAEYAVCLAAMNQPHPHDDPGCTPPR